MKKITLIDTFGFLFRSYYALPPLKSKDGFPTGMITGFMNFIASINKDFQSDYLIFALDCKGQSFRNDIFKEYKSHRPEAPDDLKKQLPIIFELIEKMGFKSFIKDRCEADDIIASIAKIAKEKGFLVQILSHDKDLYQLIEDNIILIDPIKKTKITNEDVIKKFGVMPKNFIDFQALLGDSSDFVPGVKGIGQKSASALINEFKTIENLYNNLDKIEKKRWQTLLKEGKDRAFLSKQLVTLDKNCIDEDELDLNSYTLPKENPILKVADILRKFDLNNIIKKVEKEGLFYKTNIPKDYKKEKKEEFVYKTLKNKNALFEVLKKIDKSDIVFFDTETTGLDTKKDNIVGFSFCFDENNYYVPINHFYLGVEEQISFDDAKEAINKLNKAKLVAHNFKYDYEIVKNIFGIELNIFADTMLMAWIYDPSSKVALDSLAKKFFNYDMISYKEVTKKKKDFSEVDIESATRYSCEDVWITKKLYFKYLEILDKELLKILDEVEYDFIKVLAYMENIGIKVDINYLKDLENEFDKELKSLTKKIFELSNEEFNINSTQQLGVILFEKLKLPSSKKTKTGYSTDEQTLIKLKDKHKIINYLLHFRELSKLQNTYVKPLIQKASTNNNTIYTSFLQTGTATGRLSSQNPNLQNIPVRKQEGKKIRKAFISNDNFKLVSLDYSQIELRLLAHFSKDKKLIEAFKNGEDIHLKTASELFDEPHKFRDVAKSINFGLIYGMGARKLSQTLNIKQNEAKEYIEKYFSAFPTIKNFLEKTKSEAKEKGFVTTLLGRVRKFNFENSNAFIEANYLREAVNTIFQGSASDIIKLAMIEIYKKYNNIKMVIQIHDELIFEIKEDSLYIVDDIIKVMENVVSLEVPLKVNSSIGNNWGELK